jgi:hypothetical protein
VRSLRALLVCAAVFVVAAVPAGASPNVGRPRAPTEQRTTQPPVIHELHTVIRERDGGRTLSTVLASVALLVAGGAAAYSVVVTRRWFSTQS